MRVKTVIQETVTETRERVVSDVVTCDICGAESLNRKRPASDFDGSINWLDEEATEYDATTISREKGIGSVENGRSLTEALHVCPACWPKLATWIGSFRGAGPTLVEEDEW